MKSKFFALLFSIPVLAQASVNERMEMVISEPIATPAASSPYGVFRDQPTEKEIYRTAVDTLSCEPSQRRKTSHTVLRARTPDVLNNARVGIADHAVEFSECETSVLSLVRLGLISKIYLTLVADRLSIAGADLSNGAHASRQDLVGAIRYREPLTSQPEKYGYVIRPGLAAKWLSRAAYGEMMAKVADNSHPVTGDLSLDLFLATLASESQKN